MENKKLIYADDARRAILETEPKLAYCIERIKAVDAVEVVHGRWEWYEALVNPYALCSNCGCGLNKVDALNFAYCPYCGAKMDL